MNNRERTDGLTPTQEVMMTRNVAKMQKKIGRWDTERMTASGKSLMENCVDLVERVISDDNNSPSTQMYAVDLALKMHQQNIVLARMESDEGGSEGEGQRVIVVLPANGSERRMEE